MTMPIPTAPTPYVTPATLTAAPTGISWNTIPPGRDVTPAEKQAEQYNICQRATAEADAYCNQVLRATTDTETYSGPGDPGFRMNLQQDTGNTRIILHRWPVIAINFVKVSGNATWPRQYITLPSNWAEPEHPPAGLYGSAVPTAGAGSGGQSIIIGPGYISWGLGRQGFVVQVQYINGWPHCGLTAPATAGSTTLTVDDCTGWTVPNYLTGVSTTAGIIYDSGLQETVQVTAASAKSGPGTLTLSTPLLYSHETGVAVSTIPESIRWAVILLAAAEALARGATSTTVQTVPGHGQSSGGRSMSLREEAWTLLHPWKRTI